MASVTPLQSGDLRTINGEIRKVWRGQEQLAQLLESARGNLDGPAVACLLRPLADQLDQLGNYLDQRIARAERRSA